VLADDVLWVFFAAGVCTDHAQRERAVHIVPDGIEPRTGDA